MPSIKDKSTVDKIARIFTSNGRDKTKALREVGYSESYCTTKGVGVVYSSVRVIDAIRAIDDKAARKSEWNKVINLKALIKQKDNLEPLIDKHPLNMSIRKVYNAVVHELNACTGQHSTTIHDERPLTINVSGPEAKPKLKTGASGSQAG